MKKIIANTEYDTDTSKLIYKFVGGEFGESSGYEESLYQTDGGKYFLYVNGGEDSQYPKENIKRMSADKAQQWLADVGKK